MYRLNKSHFAALESIIGKAFLLCIDGKNIMNFNNYLPVMVESFQIKTNEHVINIGTEWYESKMGQIFYNYSFYYRGNSGIVIPANHIANFRRSLSPRRKGSKSPDLRKYSIINRTS